MSTQTPLTALAVLFIAREKTAKAVSGGTTLKRGVNERIATVFKALNRCQTLYSSTTRYGFPVLRSAGAETL